MKILISPSIIYVSSIHEVTYDRNPARYKHESIPNNSSTQFFKLNTNLNSVPVISKNIVSICESSQWSLDRVAYSVVHANLALQFFYYFFSIEPV
jgi:hypothetical protein